MPEAHSPSGPASLGAAAAGSGDPPLLVPDHTLIRRVGRGSYGEVWLARNVLGTYRAVKIVYRDSFDDERPFERELAGIQRFEPVSRSHESQLNILHVGRGDGCFYYIMELADDMGRGAEIDENSYSPRTLRSELLLRGRMPVDECIRFGLALTTALEHLHRHRLVHRDIKPSNIVFVNGIPKLADIGLVARAEATMSFVGTEGYLPPEGPGTVQADIFSVGKVLYELATGRDRQQFPEYPTNVAEIPDREALAELNEVLLRACAPRTQDRYQSAAEMHADLALLQSGKSVSRMRATERRLKIAARAGVLLLLIAGLSLGAFFYEQRQTRAARELAARNRQLAEEKEHLAAQNASVAERARAKSVEAEANERIALENQYAADINLAQQALFANNFRKARALLKNHYPKAGQPDLRGFEWRYLWRELQGDEKFTFPSQKWGAWRVAFSPDGRTFATGTGDGTVKLWDFATRQELVSLKGSDGIFGLSFSPTLNLLAAASHREVWIWNSKTYELLHHLPEGRIQAQFSPDGDYLLSYAHDGVILWNVKNWTVTARLREPKPKHAILLKSAFSPDGRNLVLVYENRISVFSIPDLKQTSSFQNQGAAARPLAAFSPDGKLFITQGRGFDLKLWDVASWREIRNLRGHSDFVNTVTFSSDGASIVSGSSDQTINLWNTATGELLKTLRGQADDVADIALSPDGKSLVSAGFLDGSIRLWAINSPSRQGYFRRPEICVGFNSKGELIAMDSTLGLFAIAPDTMQKQSVDKINRSMESYASSLNNFAPNERTLALWRSESSRMDVWDVREQKQLCSVPAVSPFVCWVNDGSFFTQSSVNVATLWALPSGTSKNELLGTVSIPVISADRTLLIQEADQNWKLWRIEHDSFEPIGSFGEKRHSRYDHSAAFSPDGSLIAAAEEGTIKIWSVPALQEVATFRGHTHIDVAIALSADGRTLASISDDRIVYLWHVSTGRELLRFEGAREDHGFFSLAFSPDGRSLAARRTDADGPITWIWNAPNLESIIAEQGPRAEADVLQK